MSEIALLLGLLAVAYVGSALLAPRAARGQTTPFGSQWLVLGFFLGPHAFAVAPRDAISSFEPLALVGTSWMALVLGLDYGRAGNRRVPVAAFFLGFLIALASAAAIAASVYAIAVHLAQLPAADARVIAAGIGLAGCETAHHGIYWVLERGAAPGRLLTLLEELADTSQIVPMIGLAVLFAWSPSTAAILPLTPQGWLGITLLVGLVFGTTATMLLSGVDRPADVWSILVGLALLGTGVAWRLRVSPLSALFIIGVCISIGSRHAQELRAELTRTAPAVLLPTLLLCGALLRFSTDASAWWVLIAALAARTLIRASLGYALALIMRASPPQRLWFGLGLSCNGATSLLVGLTFGFRFPGTLGNIVLSVAACSAVLGDIIGPFGLRSAFVANAELAKPSPALAASEP